MNLLRHTRILFAAALFLGTPHETWCSAEDQAESLQKSSAQSSAESSTISDSDEALRREARQTFLSFDVKRYDAKKRYQINFNSEELLKICMGKDFNFERCNSEVVQADEQLEGLIFQARQLEAIENSKHGEAQSQEPSVIVIQQNFDDDYEHEYIPSDPSRPSHTKCSGSRPGRLRPSPEPRTPDRSLPATPNAPRRSANPTARFGGSSGN